MKILVIDDEKPTLSMFKLFLTAYGYEVHTAQDGESGLARFGELLPDIVFTDIKMPGIDGLEVLRRIRQRAPTTQVIIITGHGDMEKAVEALDLDASDFINKPVEREALNSALVRAEKRRRNGSGGPFSCDAALRGDCLDIRLAGRMTGDARSVLEGMMASREWDGAQTTVFVFDERFSVNRSGIQLLMTTIRQIRQRDIPVQLKGLSYNYYRFFQMAGMEKLATMAPAVTRDI